MILFFVLLALQKVYFFYNERRNCYDNDNQKGNSEVSVRYMQAWEERVIEQQAAREEGRKEGRQEGIKEGFREAHLTLVRKKLTRGFDAEQIAEALELDRTEVDALIEEIQLDEKRQENER